MNKVIKIVKVIIPSILLGVLFIWLGTKNLTENQKEEIIHSFRSADYFWVFISLLIAFISHISRAIRWQYSLNAIEITTSFWNRYLTILINYFTNLAIPRAGEITRCALMSRYEKQPFEKIFGTLIVERFIDLVMLFILISGFILFQHEIIYDFLLSKIQNKVSFVQDVSSITFLAALLSVGLLSFILLILFVRRSNTKIALKIKTVCKGLYEGMMTIFTMKNKEMYGFHTLIIWIAYIVMFGVCFKTLPETSNVGVATTIAGFVFGSLAMVLTQGGLGAYPLFVMQGLSIYGITETTGYALGWIIWASQTIMVILTGMIAVIILPLYNQKNQVKS